MEWSRESRPPLCVVAGGPKSGVEGVEVIQHAVCGTDGAGGGPVVGDVLSVCHICPGSAVV